MLKNRYGVVKDFKVYVGKDRKEYYKVIIFNTRQNMLRYAAEFPTLVGMAEEGFEALTHSFQAYKVKGKKKTLLPILGDILFYKGQTGAGVVAHEMDHATNHLFLKNKVNLDLGTQGVKLNSRRKASHKVYRKWKDREEYHAWVSGYLTSQFFNQYYGKRENYL